MTHPSPLPPPGTGVRQLGISTVMAGQPMTDLHTGAETIAMEDTVLLIAYKDGAQTESWPLPPAVAMNLAKGLSAACGSLISAEVGDDGQPLSWWERLTKFGAL